MLRLDTGVVIFFSLPNVEGTGILLSKVLIGVNEPTWKVVKTATSDGSLMGTYEVPEACIYDADKDTASLVRQNNEAFIRGLRIAEYMPQTQAKQISVGSKKKSKADTAKWAQKEQAKKNGTFVPRKGSKHKKPDQKGKSQKKGKR